jgi:hypothetical protein
LQWPDDIRQRYNQAKADAKGGEEPIYVNECELLGMLINAWLALYSAGGIVADEHALLYGDNVTAVSRINRTSNSSDSAGGVIMRIFGVLEIESEMFMTGVHVAGVENTIADALSRDADSDVLVLHSALNGCMQLTIPPQICAAFLNVLRGSCKLLDWLRVPGRSTRVVGGSGCATASSLGSVCC